MRLFIVSQTESLVTKRGQRHPDLAKFLKSRGVEVVYLSSNYYHAEKRYITKAEIEIAREKNSGIIQEYFKVPGYYKNLGIRRIWTNLFFAYRVWKFLKNRISKEDKVLIASRPIESLYALSILKRTVGFKLIMDVRDIWPDALNIGRMSLRRLFTIYCNVFLYPSVKRFDKFLYTCPSFVPWIHRYSKDPSIQFSPLGFDSNRFQKEKRVLPREKFDNKINLVLIGLLQRQLNVIPLIKALDQFPNITLDIYGDDGRGELYDEVMMAINDSVHSNIQMKGMVEPHLVPGTLAFYDIGLVPMDAEHAMPNKVFDYIALSMPIYSMGENDISKLVAQEKIGWFSSFEIVDIANTLSEIETDKKDYTEFALRILAIRDNYSRDYIFEQSLNFFG